MPMPEIRKEPEIRNPKSETVCHEIGRADLLVGLAARQPVPTKSVALVRVQSGGSMLSLKPAAKGTRTI